jgi:hypothetical protein
MTLSKTNVLTALLLVSLFANLALVGMLGGKYAAHAPGKRSESEISKLIKSLPADVKSKIDEINAPLQQELVKRRKDLKQQREHINSLLTRPKVGRDKWEEAFARYRKINDDILKLQNAIAINAIMALSPQERKSVADEQKAKEPVKKSGKHKSAKNKK